MSLFARTDPNPVSSPDADLPDIAEAEAVLLDLAKVFADPGLSPAPALERVAESDRDTRAPDPEAKYRALLEQIPAVVFMASLDRGISEAYVNPQIEAALGYSREEWLEDPVRWYARIHPDDKHRWSVEAAEMFLSGKPLRSAYRVIARDGRVIWFHCDARMMRSEDGRPWCIHGVAFDISDIKRIEEELQKALIEQKRLEKAILEISAREQRRIGQDLHDGLGQHLTGIAFMAKVHEAKLADQERAETEDAAKIVKLVNEAIHKTRELARGLLPVVSDSEGLMSALQLWAAEVEDLFGVLCHFQCDIPVLIHDDTMATHLYHIAREAVNNAIKHGHPRRVLIQLTAEQGRGLLLIQDDGRGIADSPPSARGMGLHIMNYRAGMIGGTLDVRRDETRGTAVTCNFPVKEDG